MSRSLKGLLHDTITSSALDMTNLGMQVLVEGIALSIFQSVVAYSTDPFIKDLFVRIQRDESRHFAVGRITLCRVYAEMSAVELREREGVRLRRRGRAVRASVRGRHLGTDGAVEARMQRDGARVAGLQLDPSLDLPAPADDPRDGPAHADRAGDLRKTRRLDYAAMPLN